MKQAPAYRVIYVAKFSDAEFSDAVYVLHAFQKKTQKTSRVDLALATKRFAEVLQEQRK